MEPSYTTFISYAWANDKLKNSENRGWVSTFHNRLNKYLTAELPRKLKANGIWIDYQRMQGNDSIPSAIRKNLEVSQLLIPILSKSWLDSPWCQKELEMFLELHGANYGRIFPVWMEPLDELPESLEALLKYKFWYKDDRDQIRTRWLPEIDPTDTECTNTQQDIARDMATKLNQITPFPGSQSPSELPEPIRPQGDHLIMINAGDDDLALAQLVAERLDKVHGIGYVMPISAKKGLKSSVIARDLSDKLKLCTGMLLIYRNGPEHQLHNQITEFLKSIPKRPKTSPDPSLDICHPRDLTITLSYKPKQMRILTCGGDLDDCASHLAELLT